MLDIQEVSEGCGLRVKIVHVGRGAHCWCCKRGREAHLVRPEGACCEGGDSRSCAHAESEGLEVWGSLESMHLDSQIQPCSQLEKREMSEGNRIMQRYCLCCDWRCGDWILIREHNMDQSSRR
jgi:hypothetical protein